MPYTYIGKMIDGKKVLVFLLRNDVQYVAQVNDVLDGTYRIEKISGDDVVMTYMPMNAQQTLALTRNGAASGASGFPAVGGVAAAPKLPGMPPRQNFMPFAK